MDFRDTGLIPADKAMIVWNTNLQTGKISEMAVYYRPEESDYPANFEEEWWNEKMIGRYAKFTFSSGCCLLDYWKKLSQEEKIVKVLSLFIAYEGCESPEIFQQCLERLGRIKEFESIRKLLHSVFFSEFIYEEWFVKTYDFCFCHGHYIV